MFVRMFELVLVAVFIWTLVTQMVIPYATTRPMFPIFRRKRLLEAEMAKAHEEVDEAYLEQRIADIRKPPRKKRTN